MGTAEKEKRLIKVFLSEYKKLIEKRTDISFNPRSLAIISQPDLENFNELHWVAYHKWYDEIGVGVTLGTSKNLLETFLDIPIQILITAEEIGKPLLSTKDQKKLMKALKLIGELDMRPQK